MALVISGFKTLTHIGSVDGAAGANRNLHAYVTNDDAATVEAADYFIDIYDRLKVGDQIMVSLDIDGTPGLRHYVVATSSVSGVTITRSTATAAA